MWLYDNARPKRRDAKWLVVTILTVIIHIIGWFCMIAGTYAAVVAINNSLHEGKTTS